MPVLEMLLVWSIGSPVDEEADKKLVHRYNGTMARIIRKYVQGNDMSIHRVAGKIVWYHTKWKFSHSGPWEVAKKRFENALRLENPHLYKKILLRMDASDRHWYGMLKHIAQ